MPFWVADLHSLELCFSQIEDRLILHIHQRCAEANVELLKAIQVFDETFFEKVSIIINSEL